MSGISLSDTIGQLSINDEWGPDSTSSTTLDGVPYAPYSKSDKLGRMADWTQEGKEGRERGGRQYGRNFRGESVGQFLNTTLTGHDCQTSRFTERAHPRFSPSRPLKTNPLSPSLTTPGRQPEAVALDAVD